MSAPELTPLVEEVGTYAVEGLPYLIGVSWWPSRPEGDEIHHVVFDTGRGAGGPGLTMVRFGPRGRSVL